MASLSYNVTLLLRNIDERLTKEAVTSAGKQGKSTLTVTLALLNSSMLGSRLVDLLRHAI